MMPRSPFKPNKNARRIRAERFGARGELLAAVFLRLKFYRLRHTRWKTPIGEIDLIAEQGGKLVFVEVKTRRRRADEQEALAAVNQRRIIRAAQFFIARNPRLAERTMRFDVIFLAPWSWPRHVRGAFEME